MNETEATESWFSRGKAEADKGIPYSERVVGIAIVVFSVLMVLYFVTHQMWSTGFFTDRSIGTNFIPKKWFFSICVNMGKMLKVVGAKG